MRAQPIRVAVVDPRPEMCAQVRDLLRRPGRGRFTLEHLTTADAALAAVADRAHDVYLVAQRVGARSGLDLVRQAAALDPSVPFILVTARGHRALDLRAMRAGAADYLERRGLTRDLLQRSIRHAVERARALESLRRSGEWFRALVEHSSDGILTTDERGVVRYASPSVQRLLGYAPRDLEGKDGFGFLHPDDTAAARRAFADCVAAPERTVVVEVRVRHGSGEYRLVESVLSNRMADPAVGAVVVNFRDVTERRHTERALRESEARFRALVEHSAVGVWQTTPDGRTLYANPAMCALLNVRDLEELRRRPLYDFFTPESAETIKAEEAKRERGIASTYEVELITSTGERRHVLVSGAPLLDADGSLHSVMGSVADITERKGLEEQVIRAQKMESVGRLAGGVAHDFNNILTAVLGTAELLLHALGPDDPTRRDVEDIWHAAQRGSELTAQLLAFSRRQILAPRVLDLNGLVLETERLLHRILGEDVELVLDLAGDACRVKVDPTQLQQAIMNLAVNARDAMPDGGTLTISTRRQTAEPPEGDAPPTGPTPGSYARLDVSDTGIGMDAATRARIFEPFFTTKEAGKGTGLGLATVYGFVTQSDGHIDVESEPGRGTTVRLSLPCTSEPEPAADSAPVAPAQGGDERILLVEDDPAVRSRVARMLASLGYPVEEAATPRDAREIFSREGEGVDLLLTDVVMPEQSGPALAADLRRARPDLAVLYMSGYAGEALERRGVAGDEIHLLQKPFTLTELAGMVRKVLDR